MIYSLAEDLKGVQTTGLGEGQEKERMRGKEQGVKRERQRKTGRDVVTKARLPLSALESHLLGGKWIHVVTVVISSD